MPENGEDKVTAIISDHSVLFEACLLELSRKGVGCSGIAGVNYVAGKKCGFLIRENYTHNI